jgi:TRAP-type C4-dicarboxylate transport system permease small subunit
VRPYGGRAVRRILDALERGAVLVGSAAMACLAVAVIVLVALRYLFSISPFWSEELIRIFLLAAVLLGAGVSVRANRHIRVEFLTELLPPVVRRAWYLLLDLVALGLFALIVVTGVEAVGFNHSMKTTALQIPVSTIIWLVPAGFAIAGVFMVEEIRRRWKRRP